MPTQARRIWGFFLVWGIVATSIIIATTTPEPTTLADTLLQGIGQIYLSGTARLDAFINSATLPGSVIEGLFVVLGGVAWILNGIIIDFYGLHSIDGDLAAGSLLFVVFVGLIAAAIGAGVQFLMLGVIGIGVSAIAVNIP